MLNANNQGVLFKVLSCIFAVIVILMMAKGKNIIDLVYLILISGFILKYFVKCCKK